MAITSIVPSATACRRASRSSRPRSGFVAVVRKAKDNYFLGATTNEEARTLTIPLDFLEKDKKYHAVIYADGEDADWKTNPTSYQIKDREVTAADTLSVVMAKGGGQAVSFIPVTD